jgi:hypothetical protein
MLGVMQHHNRTLGRLKYDPQNFRDLFELPIGPALWRFLLQADNVARLETATLLGRAAVEPLSARLLEEFGPEIAHDRVKRMIGHMVRQIMEALGYAVDRGGLRITRLNLFSSGTRYRRGDREADDEGDTPVISGEARRAWIEQGAYTPFQRWLDHQVRRERDGSYDPKRLGRLAKRYGVHEQFGHLEPGLQLLATSVLLKARVPPEEVDRWFQDNIADRFTWHEGDLKAVSLLPTKKSSV